MSWFGEENVDHRNLMRLCSKGYKATIDALFDGDEIDALSAYIRSLMCDAMNKDMEGVIDARHTLTKLSREDIPEHLVLPLNAVLEACYWATNSLKPRVPDPLEWFYYLWVRKGKEGVEYRVTQAYGVYRHSTKKLNFRLLHAFECSSKAFAVGYMDVWARNAYRVPERVWFDSEEEFEEAVEEYSEGRSFCYEYLKENDRTEVDLDIEIDGTYIEYGYQFNEDPLVWTTHAQRYHEPTHVKAFEYRDDRGATERVIDVQSYQG